MAKKKFLIEDDPTKRKTFTQDVEGVISSFKGTKPAPPPNPQPVFDKSQKKDISASETKKPTQPKVIRDQDTGEITFVEMPDGRIISGSDKELRALIEKETAKKETPKGAIEATQAVRQEQLRELINQSQQLSAAQDLGVEGSTRNVIPLPSVVEAGLGTAARSGTLVGAGIGALAAPVTGGASIPAGAAIGAAIGAFIQGFSRKLREEQEQKIRIEYDSIGKSQSSINKLITYVRRGGDVQLAWERVQKEFAAIDNAEREIKLITTEDLSSFLSVDGGDELGRIRNWKEQIKPNVELLFLLAAQNPSGANDPTELLDLEEFGI